MGSPGAGKPDPRARIRRLVIVGGACILGLLALNCVVGGWGAARARRSVHVLLHGYPRDSDFSGDEQPYIKPPDTLDRICDRIHRALTFGD